MQAQNSQTDLFGNEIEEKQSPDGDMIPRIYRDAMIDRLEDAFERDNPDISDEIYQWVLSSLFPKEFVSKLQTPKTPTNTIPGSKARVREYAKRHKKRLSLYHPDDFATTSMSERLGILLSEKRIPMGISERSHEGERATVLAGEG